MSAGGEGMGEEEEVKEFFIDCSDGIPPPRVGKKQTARQQRWAEEQLDRVARGGGATGRERKRPGSEEEGEGGGSSSAGSMGTLKFRRNRRDLLEVVGRWIILAGPQGDIGRFRSYTTVRLEEAVAEIERRGRKAVI